MSEISNDHIDEQSDVSTVNRCIRHILLGIRNCACAAASLSLFFAIAAVIGSDAHPSFARQPIKWIEIGPSGGLVYGKDEQGNRIPDFSTAGYRAGNLPPAGVKTVARVDRPSGGDDTASIQAALDSVAERPVDWDGFRGAVELGAGTFRIEGSLRLAASGVVLRGAGIEQTMLLAEGKPRTVIFVGGEGTWRRDGDIHNIVDAYVPVGARHVRVGEASGLKVGDRVIVQRPATREWISAIGMDRLEQRSHGKTRQWEPGPGLLFDRTVVGVGGNVIELDAALTNAMSPEDGPVLWKYRFEDRVLNIGIERLSSSGLAFFDDPNYRIDTYRHSNFVAFNAIEDGWIRDAAISDYSVAMTFRRTAGHVTAMDFTATNDNSPRVNAPPPMISIDGQNILVTRCRIDGRNFTVWVTQSAAPGPNVVHRCRAEGERLGAGAHQRWATGILFDNIFLQGRLHIGNRGSFGTGQGWSGANSVLWNSTVSSYLLERPPTANNWAFGVTGKILREKEPLGEIISPDVRVEPGSLYERQRQDRLGGRP